MTFYDGLADLFARRVRLIFEAHRFTGRAYDPQPRPSLRKDSALGTTGHRCRSCFAVTYGYALGCGRCGAAR